MTEPSGESLRGRTLLVVEDDYFIATDLADALRQMGAEVIGPAATVADALSLIENETASLDGAVLDINLGGELVFPVADALMARGAPFVFVSGYDRFMIPEAYATAPRCDKPVNKRLLARRLIEAGIG